METKTKPPSSPSPNTTTPSAPPAAAGGKLTIKRNGRVRAATGGGAAATSIPAQNMVAAGVIAVPSEIGPTKVPARILERLEINNQAPGYTDPKCVSVYRAITKQNVDVTWYGFRWPGNLRIPHYYACNLNFGSPVGPRAIDLYDIGAVGNRHEVDILLTDTAGVVLRRGIDVTKPGGGPGGATFDSQDFFKAHTAQWNPAGNNPRFRMTLNLGPGVNSCLLWVICYRYGTRASPPFRVPVPMQAAGGAQDDDGGPPSGPPGGEEN
jgi:hypothetical protein